MPRRICLLAPRAPFLVQQEAMEAAAKTAEYEILRETERPRG
jgi:hypothetical protein